MHCKQCGLTKTRSDFYMVKTGLMVICKTCQKQRVKQSRANVKLKSEVDALLALYHQLDDTQRTTLASIRNSRKALGLPAFTVDELMVLLGLTPTK